MILRKFFLLTFSAFLFFNLSAQKQDDRVLLTIGSEPVTVSEFLYVYNKNNNQNTIDNKTMPEYLEMFINYRLKVMEAEKIGMDTIKEFVNELAGYRAQLAKPYLTDSEVNDKILKEAYERLQWDIRASHIMIAIPENVSEDDSIAKAAYTRLMDIRKKAMGGMDFSKLAILYSDDPSAKDQEASASQPARKGNGGDLGYFTAFYMVYPFETAAYNTKVGEISLPIRTKYGYHIIKVTDRIPALGNIHVEHIFAKVNEIEPDGDAKAQKRIQEIAAEIESGKIVFEEAAKKYSDDPGSASKGGELNPFEVTRMVPEFIKAISEIEGEGKISKPVKTSYGWHLIKLLDLRKVPPYNEYESTLKDKVSRDTRANRSKEVAIENFKKQYAFKENQKNLQKFYNTVDSSIFTSSWTASKAANLNLTLFTLAKKKYSTTDFANYLEKNQKIKKMGTIRFVVKEIYNSWVNQIILDYKNSQLEKEFYDFRMLVNEYHDGILLFNISDERIWSKAIKDTAGLEQFYDSHATNYLWKERVDADVYRCKNDTIATKLREMLAKGLTLDTIYKTLNSNSQLSLGFERGKFETGDNKAVDLAPRQAGLSQNILVDNFVYVVNLKDIIPAQPKKLNEAKGLITADYQNYLLDAWVKELRAKYPVKINQEVFKSVEK